MNYGILNVNEKIRKMRIYPNCGEAAALSLDLYSHGRCPKLVFKLDDSDRLNDAIFIHLLTDRRINNFLSKVLDN